MNTNIPVKIMRVEDFMDLADKINPSIRGLSDYIRNEVIVVDLISRYEKETSQILERKHFVCEVEKPTDMYMGEQYYGAAMDSYMNAQSCLVFDGFVRDSVVDSYFTCGDIGIHFVPNGDSIQLFILSRCIYVDTIYDFIYHISKYNETASEPINLKFTENFIKRIVG